MLIYKTERDVNKNVISVFECFSSGIVLLEKEKWGVAESCIFTACWGLSKSIILSIKLDGNNLSLR